MRIANEIKTRQPTQKSFIRIGLSGVLSVTCAGALAAEIHEPLLFSETDIGDVEAQVVSGNLDFGVAFIPSPKPELEYLTLGEVRFNAYAREDLLNAVPATQVPFAVPISEFPANPMGYRNRDGWPNDVPEQPHR